MIEVLAGVLLICGAVELAMLRYHLRARPYRGGSISLPPLNVPTHQRGGVQKPADGVWSAPVPSGGRLGRLPVPGLCRPQRRVLFGPY